MIGLTKLIKTDRFNYFCTKDMKNRIAAYDEKNKDMVFVMSMPDYSKLIVLANKISIRYGGQIGFEYDGDLYYIDDGYRDTLIKSGYIVYDDYDEISNHINDTAKGTKLRAMIKDIINLSLRDKVYDDSFEANKTKISCSGNEISYMFETEYFSYTVYLNTVNAIVNKNQQRKINNLPFYPFDKKMDKYGTYYVSVFCKKKTEDKLDAESANSKYKIANDFIAKLMDVMNSKVDDSHSFHFVSLFNKRRKLINWKGI